jgi:hypothetical protein
MSAAADDEAPQEVSAPLARTSTGQLREVRALLQALKGPRKGSSLLVERLERIAERSGSFKVRERVISGLVNELRSTEFPGHADLALLTIEVISRVSGSKELSASAVRRLQAMPVDGRAVSKADVLASVERLSRDSGASVPMKAAVVMPEVFDRSDVELAPFLPSPEECIYQMLGMGAILLLCGAILAWR